jgi:hypothetical protein
MSVKPDDLAIVIQGMWPNVGRIVYVDRLDRAVDFTVMGLGIKPGWRVRAWGSVPLETTGGPRMVGFTPVGSLKPLDDLPPEQRAEIRREMGQLDFQEAMNDLAKILEEQYAPENVPG